MIETDDWHLLQDYITNNAQAAFAKLVTRHINLVYTAATRQLGNRHDAEDVTQAVFLVLANKAPRIRRGVVLSAWLLNVTRFAAMDHRKKEARRRHYEQRAATAESRTTSMTSTTNQSHMDHAPIDAVLDDAIAKLSSQSRDALVLRFFERRSYKQVGDRLGISEEAAKQRVFRGVERLRSLVARRGTALSIEGLSGILGANAVRAAPTGLASTTINAVTTGGAAAPAAIAKGAVTVMLWANAKAALIGLAALLAIGAGAVGVRQWFNSSDEAVIPFASVQTFQAKTAPAPLAAIDTTMVAQPRFWAGPLRKPIPQPAISGIIRNPDGTPAANCQVRVATHSSAVPMFLPNQPTPITSTQTDGWFSIVPIDVPTAIVVRSAAGYAIVPATTPIPTAIVLSPWVRLEGAVNIGTRPLANGTLQLTRAEATSERLNVNLELKVTTDAQGHFLCDQMLPGGWTAHNLSATNLSTRYRELKVAEQGTTTVVLGGTGRVVSGNVSGAPPANALTEGEMYPASDALIDTRQQLAAPQHPLYEFSVASNGTFLIDDVEPGRYRILIRSLIGDPRRAYRETVASAVKEITIDQNPGDMRPINLGTIALQPTNHLKISEPVPDFTGSDFHLSAYRGKYVLLHLWSQQRADSAANLANLAATYDRFGDDPRFAIVSIYIGQNAATQSVSDRPEWPQAQIEPASIPPAFLTSPSMLFMVGPDGRLVARNFDAVQAFGLVDKLLAPEAR